MRSLLFFGMALLWPCHLWAQVGYFTGIGALDNQPPISRANDVSADGSVVVGASLALPDQGGAPAMQPVLWTRSEGLVQLDAGPQYSEGGAFGVSANGSVIVGYVQTDLFRAFRWTSDEGLQLLPELLDNGRGSFAFAVSDDGTTVVGESYLFLDVQATAWKDGVATGLGHAIPGSIHSSARAVNADGTIIVGVEDPGAFRWTEQSGMVYIDDLPIAAAFSSITPDGNVIVGAGLSLEGIEAYRWTEEEGVIGIGYLELLPLNTLSSANDVSADGRVIVGTSRTSRGHRAFYWTEETGVLDLQQLLLDSGLSDVAGWSLISANGISADGLTIVGEGINPAGIEEGWVARIPAQVPEPVSVAMLALAVGAWALGVSGGSNGRTIRPTPIDNVVQRQRGG